MEWCIVWLRCRTLFGTPGALFLVLALRVEQPLYSWDHIGAPSSPRAGERGRRVDLTVLEIFNQGSRRYVGGATELRRVERDATCWGCEERRCRRVGAGDDGSGRRCLDTQRREELSRDECPDVRAHCSVEITRLCSGGVLAEGMPAIRRGLPEEEDVGCVAVAGYLEEVTLEVVDALVQGSLFGTERVGVLVEMPEPTAVVVVELGGGSRVEDVCLELPGLGSVIPVDVEERDVVGVVVGGHLGEEIDASDVAVVHVELGRDVVAHAALVGLIGLPTSTPWEGSGVATRDVDGHLRFELRSRSHCCS